MRANIGLVLHGFNIDLMCFRLVQKAAEKC